MTLGRVAVVLALVLGAVSLVFGDYDRAESDVRRFYAQVAAADFRQARQTIDEAIRLWPSNARYYGWRGYVASRNCQASARYTVRSWMPRRWSRSGRPRWITGMRWS